MKGRNVLFIITLLILTTALASAYLDHDEIKILRDRGKILSLETIIDKYRERYREQGRIIETELEQRKSRYIYELRILGEDGIVKGLYYDATTGELLIYEVYERDEKGRIRALEYDAHSGELLRIEKVDDDEDDDDDEDEDDDEDDDDD